MKHFFLLCFCFSIQVEAATRYIGAGGNNANAGTSGSRWATLNYANTNTATPVVSGDIVIVGPGTYNEQINETTSGVTWMAEYPAVFDATTNTITRGFLINSASNVKILGFEVTHNSTNAFADGIIFNGSVTNCWIIDNWIHSLYAPHSALTCSSSGMIDFDYNVIRGNIIEDTQWVNGAPVPSSVAGAPGSPAGASAAISIIRDIVEEGRYLISSHNLVEYNVIRRVGDFIYLCGSYEVARNNTMMNYENRHGIDQHVDGFQGGSDGRQGGTSNTVHEATFIGDLRCDDCHGLGIWQDTTSGTNTTFGDNNVIIRGTVAFHAGSGAIGVIDTDNVKTYHNTIHDQSYLLSIGNKGMVTVYSGGASNQWSTNGCVLNNIFSDLDGGVAINVSETLAFTVAKNIGYDVNTAISPNYYFSTIDPLFVDPTSATWNFHVEASSAAVGAGTNLTTVTSANGSGTTLNLADAGYFFDGYGIVEGDVITIAGNAPTRIISKSGNTVTLASSQTWTNGAKVYWGRSTAPTVGALPYASVDLASAVMSRQWSTNYVVVPTGDTRGVWFYVDNIPTYWDYDAPYTFTNTTGTVTAKAYALYAQATPVVTASAEVAPSLSALSLQSIAKNATVDVTLTTSDDVTSTANLAITATSSNHTLIDDADCTIAWNGSAWVLTCTPNLNQTGTATITVRSTDEGANYVEQTFTLSVHESSYVNQTGGRVFKQLRR